MTQNTIKPAQLSEAKIFSMETKQKELENKNLHDHYYIRDILKKLI